MAVHVVRSGLGVGVVVGVIPHGWKIERKDVGPFKRIHIIAPNNFTAVVESHAPNPENVLYMLADALLRRTDAEIYQGIAENYAAGMKEVPRADD